MVLGRSILWQHPKKGTQRSALTLVVALYILASPLIVECQLNAASKQFLADFRATSPGFAALYPSDDVLCDIVINFKCIGEELFEISISNRPIDGSLPNSFTLIPGLRALTISLTKLTGTIPESLGLINTTLIDLQNNLLEGTIPVSIFSNPKRQQIFLDGNRLKGSLPDVAHSLNFVTIANNFLTGTVPEAFATGVNLKSVYLSNNRISGTIPATWSPVLQRLDLSYNLLTGTIPEGLFYSYPNLGFLLLSSNQLSGTLPPSFSQLQVSGSFDLSRNLLTGTIPPILPDFKATSITFSGNRFTGDFPYINNAALYEVDLSGNLLDGTIPDMNGTTLFRIDASNNQLTGTLPNLPNLKALTDLLYGTLDNLYNCTFLQQVDVSANSFSGVFNPNPNWRVFNLKLSRNNLEGTFPKLEIGVGTALNTLDLSFNRFSGPIEDGVLEVLINVVTLKLKGNRFSGLIPNITKSVIIEELDLSNNDFEGPIPSSLSLLGNILKLSAANNRLEGELPDFFESLLPLNEIDLQFNKLSGTIPQSLSTLKYMTSLKLNANNFSGSIPASLSNAKSLQVLQLDSNGFSGTIPNEFGLLTALNQLSLENNQLEGTIPSSLENYQSLASMTLQNNRLSGVIPNSFNSIRTLKQLNLANNQLTGFFESTIPMLECNLAGNNLCCGDQTASACRSSSPCSGTRKIIAQNETISSYQQYQYLEVPSGSTLFVDLTSDIHTQCLRVNGEIGLSVSAVQGATVQDQTSVVPITFTHSYSELTSGSMSVTREEKCVEYAATQSPVSSTNFTAGQIAVVVTASDVASCSDLSEAAVFALAFTLGIGLPLIVALIVVIVLWRKGRFRRNIRQQVSMDIMNSLADKSFLTPSSSLKLDRELGAGSFGKVYVGKWQQTQVAFKFCNVPSKMDEFLREAALMMKLTPHPNVVQLLAISIDGPEPVIVLEYCEGGSLDHLLFDSNNPITDGDKIRIAAGIARGMLHLHRNSIVHRDLAARNVLMQKGTPKVSDFGMSRLLQVNQESKTYSNIGPIRWMAPESLRARVNTPKSDVWMYGIVLTEIITQSEPHIDQDPLEIGAKIRDQGVIPTLPNEMHPLLSQLVSMCMKMNADERPDFESICQHIDQYCGANGITI